MKIVIAGSRTITALKDAIDRSDFPITEVAVLAGLTLWASNGRIRKAFPYRTGRQIVASCGHVSQLGNGDYGESRGTLDMIDKMRRLGKPREVWMWDGEGFIYVA